MYLNIFEESFYVRRGGLGYQNQKLQGHFGISKTFMQMVDQLKQVWHRVSVTSNWHFPAPMQLASCRCFTFSLLHSQQCLPFQVVVIVFFFSCFHGIAVVESSVWIASHVLTCIHAAPASCMSWITNLNRSGCTPYQLSVPKNQDKLIRTSTHRSSAISSPFQLHPIFCTQNLL